MTVTVTVQVTLQANGITRARWDQLKTTIQAFLAANPDVKIALGSPIYTETGS